MASQVHFTRMDPEVRKALAYALDRDEFLALFGEPVAENVYSPGLRVSGNFHLILYK